MGRIWRAQSAPTGETAGCKTAALRHHLVDVIDSIGTLDSEGIMFLRWVVRLRVAILELATAPFRSLPWPSNKPHHRARRDTSGAVLPRDRGGDEPGIDRKNAGGRHGRRRPLQHRRYAARLLRDYLQLGGALLPLGEKESYSREGLPRPSMPTCRSARSRKVLPSLARRRWSTRRPSGSRPWSQVNCSRLCQPVGSPCPTSQPSFPG